MLPPLSARTSPAGTSGWHPAGSAGTGVPHRDPTRGHRLLLQHPWAISSSPHPPCMVSVSWCHQLPRRSPGAAFPARTGTKSSQLPSPSPCCRRGGEKPSLRAAGGRKRPGSPTSTSVTGCEKLETAARCPAAAGGSQGHGGERSSSSPGTAAQGSAGRPLLS